MHEYRYLYKLSSKTGRVKSTVYYRGSTGPCDKICLIITENLEVWENYVPNIKCTFGLEERILKILRQWIDPLLRYRALKRNKESVTVSIATISGRRIFSDIFFMLERLIAENFVKIRFLVLELYMKIGEISVPYETWHPQDGTLLAYNKNL